MKGFIFSIEALLAVVILLSSLMIISFYDENSNNSNIFIDKLYSNSINKIYFNETIEITNKQNMYCDIFVKYNITIQENTICEGYS